MGRNKCDPILEGRVLALLGLNYSERQIIELMKKDKIIISKGLIYRIKHQKEKSSILREKLSPNSGNKKKIFPAQSETFILRLRVLKFCTFLNIKKLYTIAKEKLNSCTCE